MNRFEWESLGSYQWRWEANEETYSLFKNWTDNINMKMFVREYLHNYTDVKDPFLVFIPSQL